MLVCVGIISQNGTSCVHGADASQLATLAMRRTCSTHCPRRHRECVRRWGPCGEAKLARGPQRSKIVDDCAKDHDLRAWLVPTASAQAKSKIEEAFAGANTMGPSTVGEEVLKPFELDGCVPRCDPRGEPSPSTPSTLRCASSMMTRMRRGSSPAGTGTRGLVDCDDRQWPSATIGNGHRQRSAAAIGNTSRS